jgi:uncharacterized membrane protein
MRRPGLDLMRGLAVLTMVLAHTTDAWTRLSDRAGTPFRIALLIGGFGAPAFLFMAGVTQSLAANARQRRGASDAAAAARSFRHGARIFLLAFLFEIQSFVISGGSFWRKITRVDILHIMGLVMCAGALVWILGRAWRGRAALFVIAGVVVALAARVVMSWEGWSLWLPEPLTFYITPVQGRSIFTLLPWSAFFFFGAALGACLEKLEGWLGGQWVAGAMVALGAALAVAGYGSSFLAAPYGDFWTTSPAFFFIRLGVLIAGLGLATAAPPDVSASRVLRQLGASSLFVYWVHVEMVYGVPSRAFHQSVAFSTGLVLWALLCVVLTLLVRFKTAMTASPAVRGRNPVKLTGQVTHSLMLTLHRSWQRTR